MKSMRSVAWVLTMIGGLGAIGCGAIHNPFSETGPAAREAWDSPTGMDIETRMQPSEARTRGWKESEFVGERGTAIHGPIYFEDPFVDKGAGRKDSGIGVEKGRLGIRNYMRQKSVYWGLNEAPMPWAD